MPLHWSARLTRWPLFLARKYRFFPLDPPTCSTLTVQFSHILRKSSTFTGLDFAPPRKFKDADTMSDAGSIRSNRSGVSQAASYAMRSGAGRVSRLPGDVIFTQDSAMDSLKPTWNIGGVDTKKQS